MNLEGSTGKVLCAMLRHLEQEKSPRRTSFISQLACALNRVIKEQRICTTVIERVSVLSITPQMLFKKSIKANILMGSVVISNIILARSQTFP